MAESEQQAAAGADPPMPRLRASDFYGYLRPSQCGLRVWLRAQGEEEAPAGAFGEMLMGLGLEHEARHLEQFPDHIDIGELPREEQEATTLAELDAGERVIYQGRLTARATLAGREVEIVGHPDFMLPTREGYAIRDSKLARSVSDYIRLQLITYGWLYEQTRGTSPPWHRTWLVGCRGFIGPGPSAALDGLRPKSWAMWF